MSDTPTATVDGEGTEWLSLSTRSHSGAFTFYSGQSPDAETVLKAHPPDPGP